MLSRSPLPGQEIPQLYISIGYQVHVSTGRLDKVKVATHLDSLLQKLTHQVMVEWLEHRQSCSTDLYKFWNFRDEIAVHEGILMKGNPAIIPKACQSEILCQIHTGHQGIEKGRLRARQVVYWCGIVKDNEDMLKKCAACQQHLTPQRPSCNKKHLDLGKFCQQTFSFGTIQIFYYWSITTLRTLS